MRVNTPVTDVERHFHEGDSIVSKTDLKGRITYINRTFVDVSGFSEDELIGKAHNIVRHPDMPAEAFDDLWRTLKAGKPWRGMVKNRCKNGDYYWVEANANPIRENGQVVGYMSLRTRPSRDKVAWAENAYRLVREGKAKHLKIKEGQVVRRGILGWLASLRHPTIKGRLLFTLVVMTLIGIATSAISLSGMRDSNHALETVYKDRLIPMGQIADILERVMENRWLVVDAVNAGNAEVTRNNGARMAANRDEISQIWDGYMATYLTEEEKKLAEEWIKARNRFVNDGLNAAMDSLAAGRGEEARRIVREVIEPYFTRVKEGAVRLKELQATIGKQEFDAAHEQYAATRNINLLIGVLGVMFAVAMGTILMRSILRPLRQAMLISEGVSSGDLTVQVDVQGEDEFGKPLQSLKNMIGNLRGIVADVRANATVVSTAARKLAEDNASLSQRTEEQASSLEETASSMEELTSTVKQNADNAHQASRLAGLARDSAEQGGNVVSQAVEAMSEINVSSKKIADIICVIDEIAFQTNLLALNAAVEAARAGEQGRGFAVVASEVRNLAQRSATSAKEIKALIEDSVAKVEGGSKLVSDSGQTLMEIVHEVKKLTDVMAEIASASQEQSAGIEQVNKAVMQMDELTQKNAALVEGVAGTGRAMEQNSGSLIYLMDFFRMGATDTARSAVRSPVSAADDEELVQAEPRRFALRHA
jgi:aerotaxis receptor